VHIGYPADVSPWGRRSNTPPSHRERAGVRGSISHSPVLGADEREPVTQPHPPPAPPFGVLLVNLGTPDSPEVADVRRYLAEFLSDHRVIEAPRLIWWPVLHGVILRLRPKRSAAAYRKVWTAEGSPLMSISLRQRAALEAALAQTFGEPVPVALAMRYGSPSIEHGLGELRDSGVDRVLVLPLYPQYSASTSASIFDRVTQVLRGWRVIPELRFIRHYPDHPAFIAALAESVRRFQAENGTPDRLLMSFHGIPKEYEDKGDPYRSECERTARALVRALGLGEGQWHMTFQSRFGPKEWLKPYTDQTIKAWGREGIKDVQVICPGFPTDCLETLEEVAVENRGYFLASGGEHYRYIPALNDSSDHMDALVDLVQSQVGGWLDARTSEATS